jgi:hypothetical protein
MSNPSVYHKSQAMMLANMMAIWFTLLGGAAHLTFMEKLQLYSGGWILKFIHKGLISSSFSFSPPPPLFLLINLMDSP